MALASTSSFASFDINSQTNVLDISSVLSEALILDFELMGRGLVHMDDPVEDTTFYWNEEALNSDTATVSGSITSVATSLVLASGHGARFHIGDLIYVSDVANTTEVMQITDISTDTLTITRAYNSTAAQSIADAKTVAHLPAYQEASDFASDGSVKPTARNNLTQIVFAKDLFIARSQLKRKMATIAMDVDRQLANRAIELKRSWTRVALYGEKSASAGSDTVYRTTLGLRGWIRDNSGEVDSSSEAISLADLNANNKVIVDKGEYVDTLVIGTDLVSGVAAIEQSKRNLVESDKKVGYMVNRVLLDQGNEVEVIVDGRVKTGDYFLYKRSNFRWRPLAGSGMFVIAATDFTDGVKRRIGSEGGIEVRHPQAAVYARNKTAS
jgi:Family of unknown function (DUF5309)